MSERSHIPVELKRRVKEEAGYRCAIPSCRGTSALELAHITPYAKVKEHSFSNLILLCAICHSRFDGGEIPRQSMLQYKANLGLLVGRYSHMEIRLLEHFADDSNEAYLVTGLDQMLFRGLIADGHIRPGITEASFEQPIGTRVFKVPLQWVYELTESGRQLVTDMTDGNLLT